MLRKATIVLCLIATCIAVSCSADNPKHEPEPDAGMDAQPMPAMCEPGLDVIYDEAEQTWTTEYQPMQIAEWGVMCATTEKDVYVTLSMRRYPVLDPTAELEYITTNTARTRVCVLPVHANYSMDPRYVYQFVAWTVDNKSKVMHLQIDVPDESVCSELRPEDVTGCHDGERSAESIVAACEQDGALVFNENNGETTVCAWYGAMPDECGRTQIWSSNNSCWSLFDDKACDTYCPGTLDVYAVGQTWSVPFSPIIDHSYVELCAVVSEDSPLTMALWRTYILDPNSREQVANQSGVGTVCISNESVAFTALYQYEFVVASDAVPDFKLVTDTGAECSPS